MSRVSERLRCLLDQSGLAWPGPIEHHPVIGSTSDRLKQLASEGAPEWSVVLADRQTAGRGRHGREWVSPPGNLYLSTLLRPRLAGQRLALVPLVAGVAVAEAVAQLGVEASLKWPNDVVAAGRKLAGVLAESCTSGSRTQAVVLGIGVNVKAEPTALPASLRTIATSIAAEGGRELDPLVIAAQVLSRLAVWYDALATTDPSRLVEAWRALSLPWWGKGVVVRSGEALIRGLAHGVDSTGALVVELPDGTLERVVAGEVSLARLGG
jgi:BirA family biotin operon repressor/biotin-[acetyl-CoA-carboxylase] ligase